MPEDIAALAREVGKQFKSEQDLADFSRLLKKMAVEAALGAELDAHLGYEKHESKGRGSGNSRNGYGSKILKGDHGEVDIDTPRDRNGSFEPQLVRKGQTRLT
ncbi:MAG: transposase, partial [Gammaproteobacteria bacterium]|nr:transposase [Gammaproteobacteria bacterium]